MWAVFWQSLKDRKISWLAYCLASLGFTWLYVSIYPTIQAQSANLESLLELYPESMMKAFNIDLNAYTTIGGYFSAEQFSFVWPMMVIFLMVGIAGGAIAGEIEKGTMDLLLSQPIARAKIFWGKYFAGFFMLVIFTVLSTLTIPLFLRAYHISYTMENFITVTVLSFMFALAIYSLAILLSSLFSDRGKGYFIIGGILVLMYVANIIAVLKESFSDLKYFSFFYYFNPSKALVSNQIDYWAYWVFGGSIVIFSLLAALIFQKRDISV